MTRCYVLICSAVLLRLISGAAGLIGVPSPETAYVIAAWTSWLLPLAALEIVNSIGKYCQARYDAVQRSHPCQHAIST